MARRARSKSDLGDEVAVAHRIERVLKAPMETELLGNQVGIDPERRSRQGAGAKWRHVEPLPGCQQPVDVTRQSPAVGEKVVRQQHRLGPL